MFLPAGFTGVGFDENLYRSYLGMLDEGGGLRNYPALVQRFIEHQSNPQNHAILPPTRLVYVGGSYAWQHVFGVTPLAALHAVSCLFSILALLVSVVFCWRLTSSVWFTAAVAALTACAPTQIHMGQHALIDGVFAFWGLLVVWLLWENLRTPRQVGWQISYGVALALMVMTKENAMFVAAAIAGIFAINPWLKFGLVTRSLVVTTGAGILVGFAIVVWAAGGVEQFVLAFSILKLKVPLLQYAVQYMGGPWHRYLVDLLLVSPLVIMLAGASLLRAGGKTVNGHAYIAAVVWFTYGLLMLVPNAMNLRYIVMLDMPLRFLAVHQLFALSDRWRRHQAVLLICAVLALCAYDLRQHYVLFVKAGLYELVTDGLIRAQGIVKPPSAPR